MYYIKNLKGETVKFKTPEEVKQYCAQHLQANIDIERVKRIGVNGDCLATATYTIYKKNEKKVIKSPYFKSK